MVKKCVIVTLLLGLVFAATGAQSADYRLVDLGFNNGVNSYAMAMNNKGQIVGYEQAPHASAYLWDNGVSTHLVIPDASSSALHDINDNGQMVGSYSGMDGDCPFLYDNGAITKLALEGTATSINNNGMIVGYDWSNAFSVNSGKISYLDGWCSFAFSVNNVGQAVGAYGGIEACLWQNGKITLLTNGIQSEARGINDNGTIVGNITSKSNSGYACSWHNGSITFLDPIDEVCSSAAYAINNNELIVGCTYTVVDSRSQPHACFWQGGVRTMLDTPSGTISSVASDVNDNGWMCGYYRDASGKDHAALWQPVPEPSSIVAFLCGFAGLGGTLWRRKSA